MNRSSIEWTDFTSNPIKYRDDGGNVVWACVHASEGCRNCYAEALTRRYRRGEEFAAVHMKHLTPFLDEAETWKILTHKPAAGKRCFIGDMTDVFGEWVPDSVLDGLFDTFANRPDVTFQVLTKRAARMRAYLTARAASMSKRRANECPSLHAAFPDFLPNVWIGVSVEDQPNADKRIAELLQTPAAVRFVSYEPALGPLRLDQCAPYVLNGDESNPGVINAFTGQCYHPATIRNAPSITGTAEGIQWVIVGGESGAGARPFNAEWARLIVRQCKSAGVPVFVKQLGAFPHDGFPYGFPPIRIPLKDRKGGDMSDWPEWARVREFPTPGPIIEENEREICARLGYRLRCCGKER